MATLFRAYQPALLRYLRAQAPGAAEDLAGEVWVAVARGLSRFTGDEAGFRAWLFTIARRRVADHRRQAGRRRTDPVAHEHAGPGDLDGEEKILADMRAAVSLTRLEDHRRRSRTAVSPEPAGTRGGRRHPARAVGGIAAAKLVVAAGGALVAAAATTGLVVALTRPGSPADRGPGGTSTVDAPLVVDPPGDGSNTAPDGGRRARDGRPRDGCAATPDACDASTVGRPGRGSSPAPDGTRGGPDAVAPAGSTGTTSLPPAADGDTGGPEDRPGNSGSAPGRSGSAPGRSDPPGNGGSTPGPTDSPGDGGSAPGPTDPPGSPDPPGNGGSPPDAGGRPDPLDPPGNSGSAPGHTDSPGSPGNSGSAPGRSGSAPGRSDPPGNSGSAPGHTGAPPADQPGRP